MKAFWRPRFFYSNKPLMSNRISITQGQVLNSFVLSIYSGCCLCSVAGSCPKEKIQRSLPALLCIGYCIPVISAN